jgi:energy-coupling factor transport system ATP-binding protein
VRDPVASAVKVSRLTYAYEKAPGPALRDVSLEVAPGSFVAVMGETGAGKTTLLMTLNGLVPQFLEGEFSGAVEVSGYSTARVPVQNLVREVGLVLQDPETQIFGLTVWEDAAFGPSNFGLPIEEIRERVGDSLERVGLSGYDERPTEFLSGGEKQRLATAGVLAIGPRILVLDEPTSELDPEGRDALFRVLERLQKERGITVVVAEHESEKILEYAERVCILQDGRVAWDGPPQRLFADEGLAERFKLKPPGVARLFWGLRREGVTLGESCPRNVEEAIALFGDGLSATGQEFGKENGRKPGAERTGAEGTKRSEPVLRVEGLRHAYPNGHEALRGIDVEIGAGEYVAVIGQNGAGKSTLCKHLNCLLRPTAGAVYYRGRDLKGTDTSEMGRHVGYVFQNPDHQIFSASVIEEVTYGLKLRGLTEDEQRRKAEEVLSFVGLEGLADRHPFTLGKGLRQRLAVASILALEPEILVIDEPTTGQDWKGTESMLALIGRLHREGHTIIAITHDMRLVSEHAERALIMGGGMVMKDCPAAEAFDDPEVLRACDLEPPQAVQVARRLEEERGLRLPPNLLGGTSASGALAEGTGFRA